VVEEPVRKASLQQEIDRDRSLSSDKAARRLLDIIEDGQAIARYTEGMNGTTFEENALVCDAVERSLQHISEALATLGDQAAVLLPAQPWQKISVRKVRNYPRRIRQARGFLTGGVHGPREWAACKFTRRFAFPINLT